jgi:CMD domain protein
MTFADIIDELAGIENDIRTKALRDQRAEARLNAQKSYAALFEPTDAGDVSVRERNAIAVFVAGLHRDAPALSRYRRAFGAGDPLIAALDEEIERGATTGPYGHYPEGPLSVENMAGLSYKASASSRGALGARLSAALEHAHLLVFHPRDARPQALQALIDAGWSTTEVVTLSQLVAFLTFQIRVAAGLLALADSRLET